MEQDVTQGRVFEHPEVPFVMPIPESWTVDDSAVQQGMVVATDTQRWSLGFLPNMVVTLAHLGDYSLELSASVEAQDVAESVLSAELDDYRLLYLGPATFAETVIPAVMRVASYTSGDGVPLMLHQYVVRRSGLEVSVTVTYPTADAVIWTPGIWACVEAADWTAPA